jgi:4-diphosphocytidyl-2-C-methyl-D-erythritol kinase
MATISRQSPAKINLTLHVGPVWPDGFHEIESLVARVDLCDTVSVTPRDDTRLTLACDDPSVPSDETNLALRAARRLVEAVGVQNCAVQIRLEKRIPAGSGLGGGSSNAATVLMLLNELWGLSLPSVELARIGAQLGADVPLFFHTPLCVIRGRGEQVEDLPHALTGWVVLVLPAIHSPTRAVYAAWDGLAHRTVRPAASEIVQRAETAEQLMPHLFNDLEAGALTACAGLGEVAGALRRLSGGTARMTGSGAGFFRLFDERENADTFAGRVSDELNLRVEVVPIATR